MLETSLKITRRGSRDPRAQGGLVPEMVHTPDAAAGEVWRPRPQHAERRAHLSAALGHSQFKSRSGSFQQKRDVADAACVPRNRTAKRNQVEVRRPARRDRLEQSVVGVRIHLAETIVRQTLGVVADAARIASFVAVVGMAGNRHGCFGDRRLEAELEGFRNALISAARSRVRDSLVRVRWRMMRR